MEDEEKPVCTSMQREGKNGATLMLQDNAISKISVNYKPDRYSISPMSELVRFSFFLSRVRATSILRNDCPVIDEISLVDMFSRRNAQSFRSLGDRLGCVSFNFS